MADRKPCPTPRKASWTTKAAAQTALRDIGKTGWSAVRPTRVYLCDCGRWHLTSSKRRK